MEELTQLIKETYKEQVVETKDELRDKKSKYSLKAIEETTDHTHQ
jgi:hypothetical protein